MKPIRTTNSAGALSGSFYAVNPSGHLVGIPSRLSDEEIDAGKAPDLKPGFRWATEEDIAAVVKIEADRAAKEAKLAAKSGPLKGA